MTPAQSLSQLCAANTSENITIPRQLADDIIKLLSPGVDPDAHLKDVLRTNAKLTPIERAVLTALRNAVGKIVRYEDLISVSRTEGKSSLWVHVNRLHKKINPYRVNIYSVRTIGYQMEERMP